MCVGAYLWFNLFKWLLKLINLFAVYLWDQLNGCEGVVLEVVLYAFCALVVIAVQYEKSCYSSRDWLNSFCYPCMHISVMTEPLCTSYCTVSVYTNLQYHLLVVSATIN